MAQLLEKLKYTKDRWVRISEPNGSFVLPIPDGFHYSDDPAKLDSDLRLAVVPDSFDPNEKPMGAHFSLIVRKQTFRFRQKFHPQLQYVYEEFLREADPDLPDDALMHNYFLEEGCGVLCQTACDEIAQKWNKLSGIIIAGVVGYTFQITYTHRWESNADDPAVAERFYQIASDWIKRIYVRKKPAFPQPGKRRHCRFNEQISLLLPSEYAVAHNESTDLDKAIQVQADPYKDDDGEMQYRYKFIVGLRGPDVGEAGDPPDGGSWLEALLAQMQPTKTWHLFEKPQTWLSSRDISVMAEDKFIKAFSLSALVQAGPGCALQVCDLWRDSADPDEAKESFEHLYEILNAIRINGKGLNLLNIYPVDIRKKLEIDFSEEHPSRVLNDMDDFPDLVTEMLHGMSPYDRILESRPEETEESPAEVLARAGELYQIGDQAELLVPEGFVVLLKKDDDGNDQIDAAYGPYREDGETKYFFTCGLKYEKTEDDRIAGAGPDTDWLQIFEESRSQSVKISLLKQPKAKLISWRKTLLFFGKEIPVGSVQIAIQIGRWQGLSLYITESLSDAEKHSEEFNLLYALLKGIRICGTPLALEAISPQGMQNVLDALYREEEKSVHDVTPDREVVETIVKDKLREMLPGLEFNEDSEEDFPAAMPDEKLYPHYDHKASLEQDLPGIKMVVNPHGTDYQFLPLRNILSSGDDEDEGEDEKEERVEIQEQVKRILSKDTAVSANDKMKENAEEKM